MPASFPELLNSRIFKFIIGESVDGTATEFFVHEEAIAQLSMPLHNLMRGGMTESQEGCAKWDDVSKETFERFAQFAYTGDYSVPVGKKRERAEGNRKGEDDVDCFLKNPVATKSEEESAEDTSESETNPGFGSLWGPTLKERKKKQKAFSEKKVTPFPPPGQISNSWNFSAVPPPPSLRPVPRDKYPERHPFKLSADFHTLSFSSNLAPRSKYASTCEPSETFDPDLNYTSIFIDHATLYILADYRLVDSLKALALYKLHKTLCTFQLSADNAEDVVNLAKYVYAEEGGSEGSGKEDGTVGELRALVCRYLAVHALVMVLDEGFMDLLAEGGQFVKDFFRFEVQRVVS
ncbi:BTB POZ fold protein [Rutstroemia sp. NJR-2017a WRK4]|nr:BTB POZ fold protein [Rutstroemia sp. NJR-2017a WRK4]